MNFLLDHPMASGPSCPHVAPPAGAGIASLLPFFRRPVAKTAQQGDPGAQFSDDYLIFS
jgi:hypothetical protein